VDKLISNLITILGLQRDIYTKLHELSAQKRTAIEEQDVNALERIVKEEQPLMFMLTENERERKKLVAAFSDKTGVPADEITIQDIIEICPPSFITALKRTQIELTNIIQAQVAINEINRRLIQSRLEYISFMMDSTRDSLNNAYSSSGSENQRLPRGPSTIDFGV